MKVSEYIERLTAQAKSKGLFDAEITSVGSGQGTIEGENPERIYRYYAVFTEGEQLRVYWDYDPDFMTMEQILTFDYMRYAYGDNEVVLARLLKSIPKDVRVFFKDMLNDKEYEIEYSDRERMMSKHGERTVMGVQRYDKGVKITV